MSTRMSTDCEQLGWVRTKSPDETEQALYRATEARWWPYINLYLVTWGQNVCRPVFPRCPACAIKDLCPSAFNYSGSGGITSFGSGHRRRII